MLGNPVEDLVNQGVEDAVEGATGGDVEPRRRAAGRLPAVHPAHRRRTVTLAAGSAAAGLGRHDHIRRPADPVADASAELESAGFTRQDRACRAMPASAAVYSDGEYVVLLAADGENLSYTVSQRRSDAMPRPSAASLGVADRHARLRLR